MGSRFHPMVRSALLLGLVVGACGADDPTPGEPAGQASASGAPTAAGSAGAGVAASPVEVLVGGDIPPEVPNAVAPSELPCRSTDDPTTGFPPVLAVLDRDDGALRWAACTAAPGSAFGVRVGHDVVVTSNNLGVVDDDPLTGVTAFDRATGAVLWHLPSSSGRMSTVGGLVFVETIGQDGVPTAIVALEERSGAEVWRREGFGVIELEDGVAMESEAVVVVHGDRSFAGLDPTTGELLWTLDRQSGVLVIGVVDDVVVVSTVDGNAAIVRALDARTGSERWTMPGQGRLVGKRVLMIEVVESPPPPPPTTGLPAVPDTFVMPTAPVPTTAWVSAADGSPSEAYAGLEIDLSALQSAGRVINTDVEFVDMATGARWTASIPCYAPDPGCGSGPSYVTDVHWGDEDVAMVLGYGGN